MCRSALLFVLQPRLWFVLVSTNQNRRFQTPNLAQFGQKRAKLLSFQMMRAQLGAWKHVCGSVAWLLCEDSSLVCFTASSHHVDFWFYAGLWTTSEHKVTFILLKSVSFPHILLLCLDHLLSLTLGGLSIDKSEPDTVEALVGQTVVLPCQVSPPPSSTVTVGWRRDGLPPSTQRSAPTLCGFHFIRNVALI